MTQHEGSAAALLCWTLCSLMRFTSATLPPAPASQQLAQTSASLLYIYAADPIYWPELTGKLLRDNDTLYILPSVVYKVWCEALPEGKPRIYANRPDVIAHRPLPKKSIAHVELERGLFRTLNEPASKSDSVKLWCDHTEGGSLVRTEVYLRAFAIANTSCDFSTLSGLVAEDSLVNFACKSGSGYPRPEHRCDVVTDEGEFRMPADVVSVSSTGESTIVTTFSIPATQDNQNASIECFTSQIIAYDGSGRSFTESRVQRVLPLGKPDFTFASESAKQCELILTGDYGVSVLCQSEGGTPQTQHSCQIIAPRFAPESLPLMAKIQGRLTYVTQVTFNNSWARQGGAVICALQQEAFFNRNFTFRIPAFKQSTKNCKFGKMEGGVQARCHSDAGLPSSAHSCVIYFDKTSTELTPNTNILTNGTLRTTYMVPNENLPRGSQFVCSIKQNEFLTKTFTYHVPRYTESRKMCRFANSTSGEVRVDCEFSAGHPDTRAECNFLPNNSSDIVSLKPGKLKADDRRQQFRLSYIVLLPGPEVSHAGGSVVCQLSQRNMFAKTFAHQIPEYRAPETTSTTAATTGGIVVTQKPAAGPSTSDSLKVWSTPKINNSPRTANTMRALDKLTKSDLPRALNAQKPLNTSGTVTPTQLSKTPRPTIPMSTLLEATPSNTLIETRADVTSEPTDIPAAAETTEQADLQVSNQTAVTLSLTLLIVLVLVLLMSLPIHILRRCRKRNKKAVSLGESQATAASLLSSSAAAPVGRAHLEHPLCHQLPSDGALRAVLCDVCNYRGYRVSKRDGIPDIDQYSMFEFSCELEPACRRKSPVSDAPLLSELEKNRKFRLSV